MFFLEYNAPKMKDESCLQLIVINNVKRLRKRKGISQMKLAELCNLSSGYIGDIEAGKTSPSLRTIEKIANAFEINAYILLAEDEGYDSIKDDQTEQLINQVGEVIKKYYTDKK